MKTTAPDPRPEPRECDIQRAAYFLWQERGRPAGRDVETWLEAKETLRHRSPVERATSFTNARAPRTRVHVL